MKKFVIICIAVCLLFAVYESRIELPPVDNTTPAEELITYTYSDLSLEQIEDNYRGCTIYDLARDFKIECIRDPREFFDNYLPYVVLMSDTGKRAFIYFGHEMYSKNQCNIHDRAGRKLRRKYPANNETVISRNGKALRCKTALGRTRPAHTNRHLLGTWRQGRAERDCGQGAHPRPKQRRIHRYDSGIHKEWREARKSYGAACSPPSVCL